MLRNDCSTGYDHISTSFIKPVAELLRSPMIFILNNFIELDQFPHERKVAWISPIHKINQPTEFKNHPPASTLPVLSKIYESVVLEKVITSLKINQYSISTNLVTVRITPLQHYSQNCAMTLNAQPKVLKWYWPLLQIIWKCFILLTFQF